MRPNRIRVTVGLPVYNGENFLREAIDSILGQSLPDLELIVSDNGSTDATHRICEEYARRDRRIRYFRHGRNRGASWNFNYVFKMASNAEYFKWMAHDDVCEPDFLARCVAALERDRSYVLSHPKQVTIDEEGRVVGPRPFQVVVDHDRARDRFRALLLAEHWCHPAFAVMRTATLKETGLVGNYALSDLVLLAELALRGRFHEAQEPLMRHREHRLRSVHAYATRQARAAWFDPRKAGRLSFPHWRLLREYLAAIDRAPIGRGERVGCYLVMVSWLGFWRWHLKNDLLAAGQGLLGTRLHARRRAAA